ncbi:hypothetical protein M514_01753 [Trichuris suis]|uniref:RAMA domain-containing protein n=1 Tax=Trichuris suis TaxID=68888 RepID=A0A085NT36_9BILA|nr:hypothetical protein M513_01753 [Trichuris suis]KFD72632.1 hypothetical protein M514_01753 [Trichuris suis]
MPRVEQLRSNPFQMHPLREEKARNDSTSYQPFQFSPVYSPSLSPVRMPSIWDIDERRIGDTKDDHGDNASDCSSRATPFFHSYSRQNSFYSIPSQNNESGYCSSLELSLPREPGSLSSIIHDSCDMVNSDPAGAMDSEKLSQESLFSSTQPRNNPECTFRQESVKDDHESSVHVDYQEDSSGSTYHHANERPRQAVTQVKVKQMIKEGIIEPGVNTLVYEDLQGKLHYGSLLPNGSIQANMKKGPTFRCISSWIRHCRIKNGCTSTSLSETLRVAYRGVSFGRIMRVLCSDTPSAAAVQQLIKNANKSSDVGRGKRARRLPETTITENNCSTLTSDASCLSDFPLAALISTLSMLLKQLTELAQVLPTLLAAKEQKMKKVPREREKTTVLSSPYRAAEATSAIRRKRRKR